jgi:hypothetical protein
LLNVRDDLLMSLLTSEAVVDSREYEILSGEEVEELKNVRFNLASSMFYALINYAYRSIKFSKPDSLRRRRN